MLDEFDTAPTFRAPMATPENAGGRGSYRADHVESFDLEDALADGPAVLAFFPGVYSRTCTQELCQFRDWLAEIGDLAGSASVYGVSADTPWSPLAFVDEYDLPYPLLSGFNNSVIDDYGLWVESGLLEGIARRAVFVIAPDRTVVYRWQNDEPGVLPEVDEIEAGIEAARA